MLIPLQDSLQVLEPNLANFVRLAGIGGHQLIYHPATVKDFNRDSNEHRRQKNLQRIAQYSALDNTVPCPWNNTDTPENDACDNEILWAIECDAVHALVTEDRRIHSKARARGFSDRVYSIQTAEDWLRRLHESRQVTLPNIQDAPLHSLTPALASTFFDSLRAGYDGFDDWFRRKAREDRRAWVYRDENGAPSALCIYTIQDGVEINDAGERLAGQSLKLCTFKVGETVRGRKIGELFLKAAFQYATGNACENLFIHANSERHDYLIRLLQDFGFETRGTYKGDAVLVKAHPRVAPESNVLPPPDYVRRFFPHFRRDSAVQKFIVPIQPSFHEMLFPDCRHLFPERSRQLSLFNHTENIGNAIKLAYLCHAQTNSIKAGDVLLFYRTDDEKAVTSVGVVDRFEVLEDAAQIASIVRRRTVYSHKEIEKMAGRQTKVILFRLVHHLNNLVPYAQLLQERVVKGPIQSILRVQHDAFSRVLAAGGR